MEVNLTEDIDITSTDEVENSPNTQDLVESENTSDIDVAQDEAAIEMMLFQLEENEKQQAKLLTQISDLTFIMKLAKHGDQFAPVLTEQAGFSEAFGDDPKCWDVNIQTQLINLGVDLFRTQIIENDLMDNDESNINNLTELVNSLDDIHQIRFFNKIKGIQLAGPNIEVDMKIGPDGKAIPTGKIGRTPGEGVGGLDYEKLKKQMEEELKKEEARLRDTVAEAERKLRAEKAKTEAQLKNEVDMVERKLRAEAERLAREREEVNRARRDARWKKSDNEFAETTNKIKRDQLDRKEDYLRSRERELSARGASVRAEKERTEDTLSFIIGLVLLIGSIALVVFIWRAFRRDRVVLGVMNKKGITPQRLRVNTPSLGTPQITKEVIRYLQSNEQAFKTAVADVTKLTPSKLESLDASARLLYTKLTSSTTGRIHGLFNKVTPESLGWKESDLLTVSKQTEKIIETFEGLMKDTPAKPFTVNVDKTKAAIIKQQHKLTKVWVRSYVKLLKTLSRGIAQVGKN